MVHIFSMLVFYILVSTTDTLKILLRIVNTGINPQTANDARNTWGRSVVWNSDEDVGRTRNFSHESTIYPARHEIKKRNGNPYYYFGVDRLLTTTIIYIVTCNLSSEWN